AMRDSRRGILYPELRFLLRTGAVLATVLGVSPQAVSKASATGRIEARSDGWWDLFEVLQQWRGRTRWSLQRAMAGLPPWLDLDLPLTQGMVDELVRRARAEGAYELDPGVLDEDDVGEAAKTADALCSSLVKALAAAF